MYSIHRVSHGSRTFVIGDISNLDGALASAQQLRHADEEQGVKYIVMLASHQADRKEQERNQGNSSAVNQGDPTVRKPQKSTSLRANTPSLSTRGAGNRGRLSRPEASAIPKLKAYLLERVVDGRSSYIMGEFDTLQAAHAKATKLQRAERGDNVRFRVVSMKAGSKNRRRLRRNRLKVQNEQAMAAVKLEEPVKYLRVGHSKPLPQVWGLDDRRGDIALAARQEDEIGLGIPAQWGRGRRNRKGDYIP